MPAPGSLEAHLSHQGSRVSSAGMSKLGFQSAALAALATSAPGGMLPHSYVKTVLSVTSSLQKHSPLLPSSVWSAVQALQAQAERSRSRFSKGAEGQLLTYLCEDQEAAKLQAAAAQAADGLAAAIKASAYAEAAFKADVSSAVHKLLHNHCSLPSAQSQLISSTRALVQEVDGDGPVSSSTVQRGLPVVEAAAAEVYQGSVDMKVIEQELAYLQGGLQKQQQQQQQQQGSGMLSPLEAATAQLLVGCLQRLKQQIVEEAARAAEAAAAAEAARQRAQDAAAAASSSNSTKPLEGQQAQVPAVAAVASRLAQASLSEAVPSGHLSASSSFDKSNCSGSGAEAGASSSGSSSNPGSGVPCSSSTPHGSAVPSSSGGAPGPSSDEWYFPPRHLAQVAACSSGGGNRGSLDVLLYRGSTLGGFSNAGAYPGSPRGSMDVAAAEAQLDAFLRDSKLPLNRSARTIASSMQLPPGGLSKVLGFMRDNGRVKGLALASNELGDQDVQELCAALKGSPSLRSLELPRNCIGDVGAGALADLVSSSPQLATLLLGYNHIGDQGAVALAKAAEASRGLTRLSLHSNQIGAAGCAALAQAVARSPVLVALDFLPGNLAAEADVKVLARALKAKLKATPV